MNTYVERVLMTYRSATDNKPQVVQKLLDLLREQEVSFVIMENDDEIERDATDEEIFRDLKSLLDGRKYGQNRKMKYQEASAENDKKPSAKMPVSKTSGATKRKSSPLNESSDSDEVSSGDDILNGILPSRRRRRVITTAGSDSDTDDSDTDDSIDKPGRKRISKHNHHMEMSAASDGEVSASPNQEF